MNRFSFKTLKGIYLVQLPNYRYVWREGNYGRKEYKKVNSYLLYNATNKTTKIINYDDARASIFNSELNAFVIGEHEKFLVAENRKCYYMDSDLFQNQTKEETEAATDFRFSILIFGEQNKDFNRPPSRSV